MKYSKTTDSVIPLILSKRLNELWSKNIFDSWQKTFIFKLHNNTLGYNIAVSKFVGGHSPLCTFCELSRNPEDERETPIYLFFQCRHVEPIIQTFFREILNNDFQDMTRTDFFGGFSYENSFKNTALDAINILFRQYIWRCKNIKKLPNIKECRTTVLNNINFMMKISNKFRRTWENSGINTRF